MIRKVKDINTKGEIINQTSVKCKIDNVIDGYNFIKSLGYRKIFELKDHNVLMSNNENEIYIQNVEGLGVYIEMEQKNILLSNTNGDSIDELVLNIRKYNLPLDYSDFFVKKASDMLKKIRAEM